MNKYCIFISLALFCCVSSTLVTVKAATAAEKIIYVDGNSVGLNTGSSWENAYIYLQDALADADASLKPVEIRVAQGTYTPDKGANQTQGNYTVSFELLNGVTLSGGYAGVTEPDSDARSIELYETILSGDLRNDDANEIDPNNMLNEPTRFNDNSTHVVLGSYTNETAVLDGFTIISGNSCGYFQNYDSTSRGGGIYIEYGKPKISNCTFTLNAAYVGGAIYNQNSDPNIINCSFVKNAANYIFLIDSPQGGKGGAINNTQSSPIIETCRFTENLGSSGGGIYNYKDSNSVIINCLFVHNNANISLGGGFFNALSEPVLKGCIFSENYAATQGGGIANDSYSNPEIENCTFTDNLAVNFGGAICNNEYSRPKITNCTFRRNSAPSGGAIENENGDPNFKNCYFIDNYAFTAGAIDNSNGNPICTGCLFSHNTADSKAGAIQNFLGEFLFRNCIFSGNSAPISSGGLLNTGGNFTFTNCTFIGNTADDSGKAVQNSSLIYPPNNLIIPSSSDFINCIIWNGENAILNQDGSSVSISYSDIQNSTQAIDDPAKGLIWGPGNIDIDPDFVDFGFWVDVNDPNIIVEPNDPNAVWSEGDYHLKSNAGHYDPNSKTWIIDDMNSVCIDTGAPYSLVADEPLPNGGRINMGAYGGTPQASMSPGNPLAAYWPLDEFDGNIAHDYTGNNDAYVSGPHWIDGKFNSALQFDGFYTFMNCGESRTLSTAQMTISFWLEPTDANQTSYIFSRGSTDLAIIDYNLIQLPNGKIELEIGQNNAEPFSIISNTTALPEQWTHIAVTLNGSVASIYINGHLDVSTDYADRIPSENYNLIIGSLQNISNFYQGSLDDIRIYNRALSLLQISELAQ